ncbi:MAG: aminopeptidase P family protein [Microbacteriaceae bacterium]
MSDDAAQRNENRSTLPTDSAFKAYVSGDWADRERPAARVREQVPFCVERRRALSAAFTGRTLVLPAGQWLVRSYDTHHPYRAHSSFAYYTGWGADTVADSVLVLTPRGDQHDATLYYRFPAGRGTDEFYSDSDIGEFWVGPRPSPEDVSVELGLTTAPRSEFDALVRHADSTWVVVREADLDVTAAIDAARGVNADDDQEFFRFTSEQRLVKDAFEIAEMRAAIAATKSGFEDVLRDIPEIVAHERGERLIEGTFNRRARADGNTVGYETIAAAGAHACVLHWTRNDGPVNDGDLVLMDAGVEVESLYTADITRTFPVSGTYSPIQRQVYEAVREAADAAFAVVKPGIVFAEVHAAAMAVIARKVSEWGFLPVSLEESVAETGQHHRRYMVHGTSHHLGLDVHDCGQARKEFYKEGIVREGMVFTIEPGLYFQSDDLTVPEEFRGIGVRIEDNILVTATGAENMSAIIPRSADDVEAWLKAQR